MWKRYVKPNADLESRPWIRSKKQLKCMYPDNCDGIGKFKDFESHIELDPRFKPQIKNSSYGNSVECRLRKK